MSHYPDPHQGSANPYPHPSPGDSFPQQNPPSGGFPSGEMVPHGQNPQTGGWQAPPEHYQAAAPQQQPLTVIGDIAITQHEVITPAGRFPIAGTTWTVTDMSQYNENISTAGIVLAVVFIWFCLLGLLFLLLKEQKWSGNIQVTVQGHGMFHSTMVGVHGPNTVAYVMQQVNYARQLSAMAA